MTQCGLHEINIKTIKTYTHNLSQLDALTAHWKSEFSQFWNGVVTQLENGNRFLVSLCSSFRYELFCYSLSMNRTGRSALKLSTKTKISRSMSKDQNISIYAREIGL